MVTKGTIIYYIIVLVLLVGMEACQSPATATNPPDTVTLPPGTATIPPTSTTEQTSTATPVPLPLLRVVGNKIQNEHGEVVVLRGVSIADPAILYYENHWTVTDYEVLANEWQAKIIRVPIHPSTWEHESDYAEKYLDPIVNWGQQYGLYIFLGYHAHGNPITNQVEQAFWWDGSPWDGKLLYDPNLELAKSALETIAKRYKDTPHVLYGTFNEPSYIDWRDWRPVAEELVEVIHAINPSALVFVSGTDWGYDLSGAISDPVRRENIIYETHPYPWMPDGWKRTVEQLALTVPVFIGEWGFSIEHPDDDGYVSLDDYGIPLIEFADQHDIGWTAWVWHPEWTPRMLKSWNDYIPTGFGQLVKNRLTGQVLTYTAPIPTPSPTPTAAPPTSTLSPEQEVSLFIYDDAVEAGWDINAWDGEIDLTSESVVHDGQRTIEANLNGWGNIGLWTESLDTSPYLYLEFYIYGGSQGGQLINVMTQQGEKELAYLVISDYTQYDYLPQDEWLLVCIPIEHLNPGNLPLTGILIVNSTDEKASTFYVDDIRLVAAEQ